MFRPPLYQMQRLSAKLSESAYDLAVTYNVFDIIRFKFISFIFFGLGNENNLRKRLLWVLLRVGISSIMCAKGHL